MRQYYVYIMTNRSKTLYVGITNNLVRRVYEHKQKLIDGFTKKYNMTWLAYFEETNNARSAIAREKQIKGWLRIKKITLIETVNSGWKDLAEDWYRRDSSASPQTCPERDSSVTSFPQNDMKRRNDKKG